MRMILILSTLINSIFYFDFLFYNEIKKCLILKNKRKNQFYHNTLNKYCRFKYIYSNAEHNWNKMKCGSISKL